MARKFLNVRTHPDVDQLHGHLELLNSANPAMSRPRRLTDPPLTDDAANKITELLVAALVMRFARAVELDPPQGRAGGANPDILSTVDGMRWGFACKTMTSPNPKTMFDRICDGVDQIEVSPAQRGVVIVNVKNIVDHDYVSTSSE
jgi:hypothetical protein